MPFHAQGGQTNDAGSFRSISDCTEGQERLAVVSVFRHCSPEEVDQVLDILGLTGRAEEMLAARQRRLLGLPEEPVDGGPADSGELVDPVLADPDREGVPDPVVAVLSD